ncbi:MAG: hypothetical protein A2138_18505 [Deltaproteobacteria bacterium RBG_16_71_12]|nr:MAG: hypothetical protein A2138_18505 [Deltaproteobacteria bacterium RBG_16_71_12]
MSALVVDTSSWISYFAGRSVGPIDAALEEARVHVPVVVVAELLSGTLANKERDALEDLLRSLPLCGHAFEHWARVGALRAGLRRHGLAVSTPDAHVAQVAIELDAELLTEDAIFRKVARHAPLRLFA